MPKFNRLISTQVHIHMYEGTLCCSKSDLRVEVHYLSKAKRSGRDAKPRITLAAIRCQQSGQPSSSSEPWLMSGSVTAAPSEPKYILRLILASCQLLPPSTNTLPQNDIYLSRCLAWLDHLHTLSHSLLFHILMRRQQHLLEQLTSIEDDATNSSRYHSSIFHSILTPFHPTLKHPEPIIQTRPISPYLSPCLQN